MGGNKTALLLARLEYEISSSIQHCIFVSACSPD